MKFEIVLKKARCSKIEERAFEIWKEGLIDLWFKKDQRDDQNKEIDWEVNSWVWSAWSLKFLT